MTLLLIVQIVALLFLFLCSAFFSASETALSSLNPMQIHRIRKTHARAADLIQSITSSPTNFLSTILIGNTLSNTGASVLGFVITRHFFPDLGKIISIPAMTILLLLLGDVTPKRLAIRKAETLAFVFAPVLMLAIKLLTPARLALDVVTNFFKKSIPPKRSHLSVEELHTVVEVGEEQGIIDEEARTMVDGIISLQRKTASQVMTPRVDLVGIDLDDPGAERDKVITGSQFRYLPVYRRNLDHPDSFLDSHIYLLNPERNFEAALIAPLFVPETASLDDLLTMFRNENKHAAFVMDEYGGTAGLVTTGDILEEIVGEVDKNEFGPERLTIQKMSENMWIADGSESLESINYELELDLKTHGADRISGWIAAQVGRMPHTGEIIEAQGCRVTVHRTKRNRVITVFIEKLPNGEQS